MSRKTKVVICIIGVAIFLLSLLGFAYAYYQTKVTENPNKKSVDVALGDAKIRYTDLTNETEELIVPGYQMFKVFTVENIGEVKAKYSIFLADVFNNFTRTQDVVYTLYKKSGNEAINETNYTTGEIVVNSSGKKIENIVYPTSSALVVADEELTNEGDVYTYVLIVTYKNLTGTSQNEDQGHIFNGTIKIMGYSSYNLDNPYFYDTNLLAYNIINNAKQNKNGTMFFQKPPTNVAEVINGTDEKVLSLIEDDLGISYYFRGNVLDNYVNFANMCWRIVRIEGDGSIKLILEDQASECNRDTYTGNWNIGAGHYGYIYDDYDSKYFASFLDPVTDADKSMIKSFYDFQTNKLNGYLDKLKSGNWCLGDKPYIKSETNSSIYIPLEEPDYSLKMYYDSWIRLKGDSIDGYQPTLKCNGTIINKFKNVSYNEENIVNEGDMYVGAINVDEVVYAGGNTSTNNYDYYLINDYQKDNLNFWTISYARFLYGVANTIYAVSNKGKLANTPVQNELTFRPSISLISGTVLTGGDGLKINPYRVG